MSSGPGRRQQQRFDIRLPVELSYQGRTVSVLTRNLSVGGMFVETDQDIPFGAQVQLSFRVAALPEPIETQATVRWVDAGHGLGVQFTGLRAKAVWALQKLFSEHSS